MSGRSKHPAGPNQVVVPKVSCTRLFLFWQPGSGYSWGHAHYCHEEECPNAERPVEIFFIAPELDDGAIVQPVANGQEKLSQRNPIPDVVTTTESDDDAPIAGIKRGNAQGTGQSMYGEIRKCDMSISFAVVMGG